MVGEGPEGWTAFAGGDPATKRKEGRVRRKSTSEDYGNDIRFFSLSSSCSSRVGCPPPFADLFLSFDARRRHDGAPRSRFTRYAENTTDTGRCPSIFGDHRFFDRIGAVRVAERIFVASDSGDSNFRVFWKILYYGFVGFVSTFLFSYVRWICRYQDGGYRRS